MPAISPPEIDVTVLLQIAILAGWAMLLLVLDLFIDNKKVIAYLTLPGLLAAAIAGVPFLDQGPLSTFGGMLTLDNFSLTLNWIFLGITAITVPLSAGYLSRQGIERGEFYPLLLFATVGMMLLGQGTDLIVLFLGLELLSITLYVLSGFAYPRLSSEESAMKYLLIGAFAAGFLVFGIALLYGATGSSNLAQINDFLSRQTLTAEDRTLLLAGAALVIVGFGYKVSMAPFHMWTPDVYEGAPTAVTAFMSVGAKGAGFAALMRFLLVALPTQHAIWVPALAVLAAITMIVGNVSAVAQSNVKRMLAYSSIGHAGYMLMGIISAGALGGAGAQRGVEAFLFYLVAYSLTNLGAFGVLIALEQRGEAAWNLSDFAGLHSRQPLLAWAMVLCMFSLAGVPPTAGFAAKFFIFTSTWEAGYGWLIVIGVITSAISAFFYLRVVTQMLMRDPVREVRPLVDQGLRVALVLATIGIVLVGIIPTPVVDLVQRSVLAITP